MWLSAFIFVAFVGITVLCIAGTVLFGVTHRKSWARYSGAAAGFAICVYAVLLVVSGAVSNGAQLSAGAEKHICELDCHLAYAVMGTARPTATTYAVTLRVRFDETTIGANRGNGQLYPGGRKIQLIDANGQKYEPSQVSGLETPLRPGETTNATVVFTVPASVQPATLRFEDSDPSKKLLIGSETAPLHKRTTFRLS